DRAQKRAPSPRLHGPLAHNGRQKFVAIRRRQLTVEISNTTDHHAVQVPLSERQPFGHRRLPSDSMPTKIELAPIVLAIKITARSRDKFSGSRANGPHAARKRDPLTVTATHIDARQSAWDENE